MIYRFVVTVPGLYTLTEGTTSDQIFRPDRGPGCGPLDRSDRHERYATRPRRVHAPIPKPLVRCDAFLPDASSGAEPTEIVLSNGVGQGPALSLRLISFPVAAGLSSPSGSMPEALPSSPSIPGCHRGPRTPATARAVHTPEPSERVRRDLPAVQVGGVSFRFADDGPCGPSYRHNSYAVSPEGQPAFDAGIHGVSLVLQGLLRLTTPTLARPVASRPGRLYIHGALSTSRASVPSRRAWCHSVYERESRRPDGSDRGRSGRRRPSAPGSCRGPVARTPPIQQSRSPFLASASCGPSSAGCRLDRRAR